MHTIAERIKIVTLFLEDNRSIISTQALRRFYGVRTVPTAPAIYSLMKNFEQFGSVGDLSYSLKNKLLGQFLCHKIFRMPLCQ